MANEKYQTIKRAGMVHCANMHGLFCALVRAVITGVPEHPLCAVHL
jgi:hypothetical protein